mmetsp:Transcript_67244/g.196596  ORF Transcript_67244/g.196596 Transcript_67244/m.196596 type:complete len:236 (-) Transcript_67244:1100-1807(-)
MPAPTLTTARRSAAPRVPSPEGLSSSLKAVCSGSCSVESSPRERSQMATHSTQSTAPLQSRSKARARASKCCAGTVFAGVSSTSTKPCTNSAKSIRPSSFESRAKKRSYQGTGSLHCMSSSSEVICAQTMSTSCCSASRRAKRQRSLSNALPPSTSKTTWGSSGLLEGRRPRGEARMGWAWRETDSSTLMFPTSTQGCRKASALESRADSSTTRSLLTRSCASLEEFSHASRVLS